MRARKRGSRPRSPPRPDAPREKGRRGDRLQRSLLELIQPQSSPARREQKERDLDPAAGGRAWMSRPGLLQWQGAGRRPRAGSPQTRQPGGGGVVEQARTWKPSLVRHSSAGSFLAVRPSFHLGSLCLGTWSSSSEGRAGAGRQGGPRGVGEPTGARESNRVGPASGRLSWSFHRSGTGSGQRPRAGQGPSREPVTVPLAGASLAPGGRGRGGDKSPCSCPRSCFQQLTQWSWTIIFPAWTSLAPSV